MDFRRVRLAAGLMWVLTMTSGAPHAAVQSLSENGAAPLSFRPVVDKYCVTCHNERLKTAGLALDKMDLARVPDGADVWEKVVRKLRGNMMPPAGRPRPDATTVDALVTSLETALDSAALTHPNPGRTLLHRFNRTEYGNAIRDLLSLDVDVAALLPPDDSSYGFDNIADVLGVSPLLMERYVSAAEKISALAVGDPSIPATAETYRLKLDYTQTDHIEGLPIGTRGGTLIHHTFPLDGEYVIKIKLTRGSVGYIRGLEFPHNLEISLDGERVLLAPVGGPSDYHVNVINNPAAAAMIEARLRPRVRVKAGPHDVAATFVLVAGGSSTGPQTLRPFLSTQDPLYIQGLPTIESVTIEGPYKAVTPPNSPSRRAVFACRPSKPTDEAACARTILARLARRAYRRPVGEPDVQPLLQLYETGRRGGTFDGGIELAMQGVLTSPDFLFRAESDPVDVAAGSAHRITDLELASRLSFFLWSSLPDEPLLIAAGQGRLHEPATLTQQVRRMLADPRAERLVANFGGQWLQLRNLPSKVPQYDEYPDFDDNLRQAMRRETELLLGSVVREDRNVLDLLSANYTFVNERLARHYGMRGITGSEFRRVTLTDPNRFGLLGQASILTVTSFPARTSPVVRGRWILENIIGTPPPPPPANLDTNLKDADRPQTMRERMESHRSNPACATCHRVMDPLGFSLENFDAVGVWRGSDHGNRIDPSDTLADGTKVDGPVALRQALLRRPEMFVGTLTEKLLTYALGRGLASYDMPAVRTIVRGAGAHEYRFSSIVLGIVNSVPFQMRLKPSPTDENPGSRVIAAR
jgi:hypothetical protein